MHHSEIGEASPHQALSLQPGETDACIVELEHKNGQKSEARNKQCLLKMLNDSWSNFEMHIGIFRRGSYPLISLQNEAGALFVRRREMMKKSRKGCLGYQSAHPPFPYAHALPRRSTRKHPRMLSEPHLRPKFDFAILSIVHVIVRDTYLQRKKPCLNVKHAFSIKLSSYFIPIYLLLLRLPVVPCFLSSAFCLPACLQV